MIRNFFGTLRIPIAVVAMAAMLSFVHATSAQDGARAFVERFLQTLSEHYTHARYSRTDMLSFISKRFMSDRKIDPRELTLNAMLFTEFEIVDEAGPYFDVSISSVTCSLECPESHILRLKVVEELGSFALVPRRYKRKSKFVDFWWANMRDDFRRLKRSQRADTIESAIVPEEMLTRWVRAVENDAADSRGVQLVNITSYQYRRSLVERFDSLKRETDNGATAVSCEFPKGCPGFNQR